MDSLGDSAVYANVKEALQGQDRAIVHRISTHPCGLGLTSGISKVSLVCSETTGFEMSPQSLYPRLYGDIWQYRERLSKSVQRAGSASHLPPSRPAAPEANSWPGRRTQTDLVSPPKACEVTYTSLVSEASAPYPRPQRRLH